MTRKNTKPSHRAHVVRNYKDENGAEQARWTEIGVVFAHADGKGFDVILEAMPVNGRIVIRANEPKPEKTAA